jgi:glutathione-regulated potassium-efflux system protein KefB
LLISNAQDQARESGVSVEEKAAENATAQSTRPAEPS